ncbi:CIA30 family protein [Algibacter pacificus]|uniref:CIA30 family protein n=1 Tax=Algibacter pacificus TaxID=2599389 RepID=UPI0011CB861B|nr:CIA30 family protein [Algibacter pacificus]
MTNAHNSIFEFNETSDITPWKNADDVVMGGKSSGAFYLNKEGKGVFKGHVSLENNGGFSSLKYQFDKISTKEFSKIRLKVKGDGKRYQFRIKHKTSDKQAYISYFNTTEDWEIIEFSLAKMHPTFRGKKLDMPNYDADGIEEIGFLIANKKAEHFKLEIDSISLK